MRDTWRSKHDPSHNARVRTCRLSQPHSQHAFTASRSPLTVSLGRISTSSNHSGFRLGLELLSLQRPSGEHEGLLAYLEQLVPMVHALPVGGELVVPAAWDEPPPPRGTGGMAFVLVLHRADEGSFNVAVCNWGQV